VESCRHSFLFFFQAAHISLHWGSIVRYTQTSAYDVILLSLIVTTQKKRQEKRRQHLALELQDCRAQLTTDAPSTRLETALAGDDRVLLLFTVAFFFFFAR
jgi:hypothetical protein